MKKRIYYVFYVFSLLFLASCSNDDLNLEKNERVETEQNESIEFMYKGKLYSSTYFSTQDSLIILNDKIANEVYQNLGLNPTLAVVINENGVLTYYDNYDEFLSLSALTQPTLKVNLLEYAPTSFTVDMFEDSSYNGKKISFTIDKNNTKIYIPSLRTYNMNDKISSLKYRITREYNTNPPHIPFPFKIQFTLFQDDNYEGRSIIFGSTKLLQGGPDLEDRVRRLKEVSMGGGKNWNDRASSAIIGQ